MKFPQNVSLKMGGVGRKRCTGRWDHENCCPKNCIYSVAVYGCTTLSD